MRKTAQNIRNENIFAKQKKFRIYRIYSSERPRRSFNFRFSKEGGERGYLFEAGALSKEALIKYIKKTSKYFRLVIIIEA